MGDDLLLFHNFICKYNLLFIWIFLLGLLCEDIFIWYNFKYADVYGKVVRIKIGPNELFMTYFLGVFFSFSILYVEKDR